ncbi:MFS transporter [Actinoplanes sp. CA-142083]|uniref:MFS transporter n=1 Tax=Actinoplanes sp. CA-142083 TaxID=3239903 RepID=UPI003D8B2DBB
MRARAGGTRAGAGALRRPGFRRLWLAGVISDTGDWLLLIALPTLVYQLTGSVGHTSFAFLAELVPAVLLGAPGGYLADRCDRRRLLVVVAGIQALALLPLLLVHGREDLPVLYGVIAVQAGLLTVSQAAKNALVPALAPAGHAVSANSLMVIGQNVGRLVGGPLGGLLLAVSGLPTIVVVDSVSFLAAAALIQGITGVRTRPADRPTPGDAARTPRPVRIALAIGALTGVAQGIFVVLFVVWVARELGGGAAETGLLRGVQAVGTVAAGILLAVAPAVRRPAVLVVAGGAAFGLVSFAIWNGPAVTTSLPLYIVLFIAVGLPALAMVAGLTSVLQQATTDRHRGRTFGLFGMTSDAGSAAGMLAAGLLTEHIGLTVALNAQAALYVAATAVALMLLRHERRSHPPTAVPGPAGTAATAVSG